MTPAGSRRPRTATVGDRSKLPAATAIDLTMKFAWDTKNSVPPIPADVKLPAPKVGVRTVMLEVKGPGAVQKFSDEKQSGPAGRRRKEKLVSSYTVDSLQETRLEQKGGRLLGYKKSHVYLTEPGKYTIRAKLWLSYGRNVHIATSTPVEITVVAK